MFEVLLTLLAGVAGQPTVVQPMAPAPLVRMTSSYSAPLPPLPGAEPAVRAVSNRPLPQLFSTDDYPSAALRNDEQGTVAFAAAVDPTGRVTACSITQGSGSASLDWATCSIIQRRARFSPARDADGAAVEDHATGRVRWVLPPQRPMPFADHRMALVFTTDEGGAVTACRVEASSELPGDDRICPPMMMLQARSIAAEAARTGALKNRELVLEQGVLVGGPDRTRNVAHGAGELRKTLFALVLEVNPAGTVSHCAGANGTVDGQRVIAACGDSVKRKFFALDPANSQSTRHAVRYWASYTRPID